MDTAGASGVTGDSYTVSAADQKFFEANGYVLLKQVVTEQELQTIIEPVYLKFINGEVHVPGKDLCDMSGAQGRTPDQFTVYNVMLPRVYYPAWQGNVLEKRCKAIADQLRGGDMHIDFDQIFAKRASSADSAFLWHQDAAYWPPLTSDTSAANCWLALSDVTQGMAACATCLAATWSHSCAGTGRVRVQCVGKTREESHAICTDIDESEERVVDVAAARGDLIVHHERTLHCSYPNLSREWRHAYILNLRKAACIAEERALGFNHSHNTQLNWDVFSKWP
ncbi:PhyH-domain-containing protein [Scenedesmus sp. NREL 46B-D3]|nr:PhyH-domain-containing protein [Scenedesmus sp. NREL 46B-D3]